MNRISKYILTMMVIFFMVPAYAATGFFYNEDRSGEGIIVATDETRIAFAYFTYWDAYISIPPVVSPAPDPVPTLYNSCPTPYIPGIEIPPTVSPAPPDPDYVTPTQFRGGHQAWFAGVGEYIDGIAIGGLYWNHGVDYPRVHPVHGLSIEYQVATFMIERRDEGGFDLYLDCNQHLPTSLFMCNNVLTFRRLLIGEQ